MTLTSFCGHHLCKSCRGLKTSGSCCCWEASNEPLERSKMLPVPLSSHAFICRFGTTKRVSSNYPSSILHWKTDSRSSVSLHAFVFSCWYNRISFQQSCMIYIALDTELLSSVSPLALIFHLMDLVLMY